MSIRINGTNTAANPGITGADTDTGLSFGTNEVSLNTAGTERFRVGSAGQFGIGGATYGTSGQVLTSQGSGSAPQWATPAAGGKILQVVQPTPNGGVESTTSTSYEDIPDITATIEPSSTSNKVLVLADLSLSFEYQLYVRMFRGTYEIYSGDSAAGKETALWQSYSGGSGTGENYFGTTPLSRIFLDSPATTDPTTYKFQWRVPLGTAYLNRTVSDTGNYVGRTASSITLMEVAA